MRKLAFVFGVAIFALGSSGTAQAGWGPGFLYSDFPVGVFFDAAEDAVVHVGFRLDVNDVTESSPTDPTTETVFGVAGALMYDLVGGSNWGFGVSPSVAFTNFSPVGSDLGSSSTTMIGASLRGHWDPIDAISIWFGHGVAVRINSPDEGDSTTDFFTTGQNITDLGFTVWIP